jgi:uncharacterized OsmC-like protein
MSREYPHTEASLSRRKSSQLRHRACQRGGHRVRLGSFCFLFTFRSVTRASKFEFISLELSGQGRVARKDGKTRFTEILLRPRLRLPTTSDKDRGLRLLEKSEEACLVSASLSAPVKLEREVLIATT